MPETDTGLGNQQELPAETGLKTDQAELPEKEEGKQTELPKEALEEKPAEQKGESGDSDFNFSDLEEKAPKAFRGEIKKAHAWITKKRQADAEARKVFEERIKDLEKRQLTKEVEENYNTLWGFYENIRTNPVESMKRLVRELKITPEQVFDQTVATPQKEPDLTLDKLETREDYVRYVQQEIHNALAAKDKEIADLKAGISSVQEDRSQEKLIRYGIEKINEAVKDLPGFLEDGKLSQDALKAIDQVKDRTFTGPNAIKNAWATIRSGSLEGKIKEAEKRAEEANKKLEELRKNLNGATNLPKNTQEVHTVTTPSRTKDLWRDLKRERLTIG